MSDEYRKGFNDGLGCAAEQIKNLKTDAERYRMGGRDLEFTTALNVAEATRLCEYRDQKEMSISAVLRQALRVYDMMERTPGAYEAVRKLLPPSPGCPALDDSP